MTPVNDRALSAGSANATNSDRPVSIAGATAVVAGALSMAASEYVSVKAERYGPNAAEDERPARQGPRNGVLFALAGTVLLVPFLFFGTHVESVATILVTAGALFLAGLFRALPAWQTFVRSGLEMLAVGRGRPRGRIGSVSSSRGAGGRAETRLGPFEPSSGRAKAMLVSRYFPVWGFPSLLRAVFPRSKVASRP